jgi:hypothetical protein
MQEYAEFYGLTQADIYPNYHIALTKKEKKSLTYNPD